MLYLSVSQYAPAPLFNIFSGIKVLKRLLTFRLTVWQKRQTQTRSRPALASALSHNSIYNHLGGNWIPFRTQ